MPAKDYNNYMKSYMQNRRRERRQRLIDMAGNRCIMCGSISSLQFDHIDPSTKSFQLDNRGMDRAWNSILEELEKCQLLCEDCHKCKSISEGSLARGGGRREKSCKLTPENVKAIRKAYSLGNTTQQQLANKYKVSRRLVGMVIKREIWKDIPG